jgi:GTP cyclohydrolase I
MAMAAQKVISHKDLQANSLTRKKQELNHLPNLFESLIASTGDNIQREGLQNTPLRAAKAFQHLTRGYTQSLEQIVNGALFACDNNEMVITKNIEFFSLCEHHLLPMLGKCHIGYIPNGKILGLSKLARIVDMYARRLQVQENLTKQIATAIKTVCNAQGVAVVMEATHLCMLARGVEKQLASTNTYSMLGVFKKDIALRKEFLATINDHE